MAGIGQRSAGQPVGEVGTGGQGDAVYLAKESSGNVHRGLIAGLAADPLHGSFSAHLLQLGKDRLGNGTHAAQSKNAAKATLGDKVPLFLRKSADPAVYQQNRLTQGGGGEGVGKVVGVHHQQILARCNAGLLQDRRVGLKAVRPRQTDDAAGNRGHPCLHLIGNGADTAQNIYRTTGGKFPAEVVHGLVEALPLAAHQQDRRVLLHRQVRAGQGVREVGAAGDNHGIQRSPACLGHPLVRQGHGRVITVRAGDPAFCVAVHRDLHGDGLAQTVGRDGGGAGLHTGNGVARQIHPGHGAVGAHPPGRAVVHKGPA